MSAYFIVFVKRIHDPAALEEYKRIAAPLLPQFGATFRILRGAMEVLEGEPLEYVVMVEFATLERARAWYHSPRYQEALKHRLAGSVSHTVLCESFPHS
jgi:uncharacterized protein (DUF1330 family)